MPALICRRDRREARPATGQSPPSRVLPAIGQPQRRAAHRLQHSELTSRVALPARLVEAINKSQTILTDLQELNRSEWVVRYPQLKREKRQKPRRSMTFADDPSKETEVIVGRQGLSRSLTLASIVDAPKSLGDSQSSPTEVAVSPSLSSLDTVVEGQDLEGDAEEGAMSGTMVETDPLLIPPTESDFHVLRLDLKLNHSSHFTSSHSAPSCTAAAATSSDSSSPSAPSTIATSPASLVSHLEKSSIASLLGSRISAASAHLTNLEQRVKSPLSKVLVTGDLNAGKSTLVNRLLGREIVPVDQQPCTAAFCEVKDAKENAGLEEVHVCKEGKTYDVKDDETYTRHSLEELDTLATEGTDATMIKVYVNDGSAPNLSAEGSSQDSDSKTSQPCSHSLLSNPVTSLALIDAPGLNRDSLKTTALFASHTEIDVILFVVSAENHFTLSAKEFLWTAGREKRYVFVVVNKFGGIRDKERCKGVVGGQVKGLSPGTWEGRGMLVHFVEAGTKGMVSVKGKGGKGEEWDADEAFESMEAKLRKFVLEKRVTSKLLPAKTYLEGLLGDVELLLEANRIQAEGEQERVLALLKGSGGDGGVGKEAEVKKMQEDEGGMEDELEDVEECGVRCVEGRIGDVLEHALEMVEQGKLPARLTSTNAAKAITSNAHVDGNALSLSLPEYPGVWSVLQYARDVRRVMLEALDQAVRDVEDEARGAVEEGVNRVGEVGRRVLPEEVERERRRRVFRKEAMFAREKTSAIKKHHKAGHGGSKAVYRYGAANGVVGGLGLALASREELLEVGLEDLFDYREWFGGCFAHHSSNKNNKNLKNGNGKNGEEDAAAMTALSILGVSLGTLPLVSSHVGSLGVSLGAGGLGLGGLMGIRSLLEASVKVVDMIRDEEVRKWIAPVIGAVVLGSVGWVVVELPRSVPRSVGRRVSREVRRDAGAAGYLARVGSGSAKGKARAGEVVVKEKDEEGEDVWIKAHTYRITRETRKVLRLAAWDVREKWRGVYEERVKEVRGMEEVVKKCERAVGRMAVILGRCGEVRQGIVGVGEMAEVGAEEVE
ncbi:mitofusin [Pleurotus pulmonarius]|nr:mitofusin [Pleurotus pulmonarius]